MLFVVSSRKAFFSTSLCEGFTVDVTVDRCVSGP